MARASRGRYLVCFAFFSQSPALQNSCYVTWKINQYTGEKYTWFVNLQATVVNVFKAKNKNMFDEEYPIWKILEWGLKTSELA